MILAFLNRRRTLEKPLDFPTSLHTVNQLLAGLLTLETALAGARSSQGPGDKQV
jgi:hypothetical protein